MRNLSSSEVCDRESDEEERWMGDSEDASYRKWDGTMGGYFSTNI